MRGKPTGRGEGKKGVQSVKFKRGGREKGKGSEASEKGRVTEVDRRGVKKATSQEERGD